MLSNIASIIKEGTHHRNSWWVVWNESMHHCCSKAIASSSETTPHRSRDWRQVKSKIFQGEVYNTQTVSLVVARSEEKSDCSCRRSHRHIHKHTKSLMHSRVPRSFWTIVTVNRSYNCTVTIVNLKFENVSL